MPYDVVTNHSNCPSSRPVAVVKKGDGKVMGCHASRERAQAQQRALYAAEGSAAKGGKVKAPIKREAGIDRPARDYAYVPDVNAPATWRLPLTEAPGRVSIRKLHEAALALSPGGLHGVRVEIPASALSAVKRRILGEYRRLKVPENRIPMGVKAEQKTEGGGGRFALWKEKGTGRYRWMAVYSNNFLDQDNPPEIISEKSHRTFVKMVDAGLVDYPELWHWHIPGTAWGKADMVDYVDGFALAVGHVYPGHEKEAEALAGRTDLGVSHGMPFETLLYDPSDPSVIDFHVTKEISVLPHHAAANPLTDFVVLGEPEETNMGITDDKRDWLIHDLGLDEEGVKSLERNIKEMGELAHALGLASKETDVEETDEAEFEDEAETESDVKAQTDEEVDHDEDDEEEPQAPAKSQSGRRPRARATPADTEKMSKPKPRRKPKQEADEEEDEMPSKETTPTYVTREEVAEAFAQTLAPILETINAQSAALKEMGALVKELSATDAERIAQVKEQTPTASLSALIANQIAIGREEAKLDGRTQLAKEGPVETEAQTPMYTPVSFVNGLMKTAISGNGAQAQS